MKVNFTLASFLFTGALVWAQPASQEETKAAPAPKPSKKVERMRRVLKYGNAIQVRDSLKIFLKMPEEEQTQLIEELRLLKESRDILVRRKFVEVVGKVKWGDLDTELPSMIDDNSSEVFLAALVALERKKVPEALPAITSKIQDADFENPNNILPDLIRVYGVYKDNALESFLFQKLKDERTYYEFKNRIMTYFAKIDTSNPEAISHMQGLVVNSDESMLVRSYAAYALGELEIMAAKGDLRTALDEVDEISDPDQKIRYRRLRIQLITALAKLQDEQIFETLVSMAKDDDEVVRIRAIRQLSEVNNPEVKELLEFKASYDPSPKVQREAKTALEKLEGQAKEEAEAKKTETKDVPELP